ncbi:MAG: cobalamin biosynthesis protein CbiM [Clostridiaceae bacterium]|jgi:cobalt/nickel transport system permease protein|nr:cobalamin biosynthesis protein CbiM [Clostridiaceae bacterium]
MGAIKIHIPDNYLSPSTCAVLAAVMVPIWKRAASKVKSEMSKKKMPLLGICSAFSFLIMMFNVPLPGGTTAHAVGGVLLAILLGPNAAVISVTIALLVQALFFGDGGILAFGANTFNMAFIMPYIGYLVYTSIRKRVKSEKGEYIAAFIGSYIGIVTSAAFTAIEFGIQPLLFKDASGVPLYCPYPITVSIPAMVIPHLLVGILEGAITVGVYAYVKKMSPGSIYKNEKTNNKSLVILIVSLIILSPIGLIASGTAWGEWNVNKIKDLLGFVPQGMKNGVHFKSFMPGYSIMGIHEFAAYIISALLGVTLIIILFKLIIKNKKTAENKI